MMRTTAIVAPATFVAGASPFDERLTGQHEGDVVDDQVL